MDKKLRQEKLKMWRENLKKLETELSDTLVKKGEAAQQGDLSENAAYTMATEDAETYRVQIEQVKKIIQELESPFAPASQTLRGASRATGDKGGKT